MRFTKKLSTICLALLITPILAIGAGCEESAEGREIELLVDDIESALERGSAKQLLANTTGDFVSLPGRQGRRAVSRQLYLMFRLHGALEALHPRPEIEVESADTAQLSVPFLLVPQGAGAPGLDALYDDPEAWIERATQIDDVSFADFSLVRRGDRWLVQTARFH